MVAASFSSTTDVMKLAGIHHMSLPPNLLEQLSELPSTTPKPESLLQEACADPSAVSVMFLYRREDFMKATEWGYHELVKACSSFVDASGVSLTCFQAIDRFCDMQNKLEKLIQNKRNGSSVE